MSSKKWTPERFVEEAMERIEILRKHLDACGNAAAHLDRRGGGYGNQHTGWDSLRRGLLDAEVDEWRHLMMFGLTLSPKKQARIKAAAHDRFLKEGNAVAHWWNDGISPSMWLNADEDKFREMCRKAFAPKEEKS